MGVSFLLDHLVIAVCDLSQAINDYKRLGFNVILGGRHLHAPTQNALVYFSDGVYLELIEWTAPALGEKWYERLTKHGEGLVDFAFFPSRISSAITQAEAGGVQYRGPIDGSRIKPTGEHVQWQLGWPASDALPFLCGDITPRALRVPEGNVRVHQNGASGVVSIAIRVNDLEKAAKDYRVLLGPNYDRAIRDTNSLETSGLEILSIQLGSAQLHLVSPSANSDSAPAQALRQDLILKGEGVYCLVVSGVRDAVSHHDIIKLSHGVPMLFSDTELTLTEQVDNICMLQHKMRLFTLPAASALS